MVVVEITSHLTIADVLSLGRVNRVLYIIHKDVFVRRLIQYLKVAFGDTRALLAFLTDHGGLLTGPFLIAFLAMPELMTPEQSMWTQSAFLNPCRNQEGDAIHVVIPWQAKDTILTYLEGKL